MIGQDVVYANLAGEMEAQASNQRFAAAWE